MECVERFGFDVLYLMGLKKEVAVGWIAVSLVVEKTVGLILDVAAEFVSCMDKTLADAEVAVVGDAHPVNKTDGYLVLPS
jgi:hypothetical protein